MSGNFQNLIDPYACVDQHRDYQGELILKDFSRVQSLGVIEPAVVHAELNFRREGRFPVVKVRIRAELVLECMACLEPFDWQTDYAVQLIIVETEDEIDFLPDGYEPWLLEDDTLTLAQLVEDELILLLPQVPRHEVCNKQLIAEPADIVSDVVVEKRKNPFEALKALKDTDSSGD